MSLWNTLKQHAGAQFLEVIEWLDNTKDTIVWRFPVFNQAITDKSKLVVREGQAAVFQSEGRLSDVFGPGTYTLDTKNTPIFSFFTSIAYQLNYPYKGDVYFVSTRQFTDNGWGTATPIMMRDAEFGPVRIRAYGIYTFRITDPASFIRQIVGTDGLFTTDEISGQLKRKLVSALADTVGQAKIPVLDLAANYMDLADKLRERMNPMFAESMGITLTDFTIQNISLPEEVEKALDARTKMGVLGNLDAYAKLQMTDATAEAMKRAASNPGMASMPMAMGVGLGMGSQMGATMGQAMGGPATFDPHTGLQGPPAPMPPPMPQAALYHYSGPAGQGQFPLSDVVGKVAGDPTGAHMVWTAGWAGWKPAREVPEIASQLPPPQIAPPPAARRDEVPLQRTGRQRREDGGRGDRGGAGRPRGHPPRLAGRLGRVEAGSRGTGARGEGPGSAPRSLAGRSARAARARSPPAGHPAGRQLNGPPRGCSHEGAPGGLA